MERLVGHVIKEFNIHEDGYEIDIITDKSIFKYASYGDCCALAYIVMPEKDELEAIVGQLILNVEEKPVDSVMIDTENYVDTCFYTLWGMFSLLDIELRVEHNGYYGGEIAFISEIPLANFTRKNDE